MEGDEEGGPHSDQHRGTPKQKDTEPRGGQPRGAVHVQPPRHSTGVGGRPQRAGSSPGWPHVVRVSAETGANVTGRQESCLTHATSFHHHGPPGHLDPPLSGDAGQMHHTQGQALRDGLMCSWDLCVTGPGPSSPREPRSGLRDDPRSAGASTSSLSSQLSSKRSL